MRINVKLYGDLKRYSPCNKSNFILRLETGATLEDVQKLLSIPDHHVSLINGRRVGIDAMFAYGDTLVLMPPISGG